MLSIWPGYPNSASSLGVLAPRELKTLDGIERALTGEMLVIADADRPVAVAASWVARIPRFPTLTVDVLIESAYFDSNSVRRTARPWDGYRSITRFERGVDYGGVTRAQSAASH